jgi:hypothetical protein
MDRDPNVEYDEEDEDYGGEYDDESHREDEFDRLGDGGYTSDPELATAQRNVRFDREEGVKGRMRGKSAKGRREDEMDGDNL